MNYEVIDLGKFFLANLIEMEKKNKKSQIRATFKCLLSCPFKSEAMVSGPKDT